jgi:hypothetical protein
MQWTERAQTLVETPEMADVGRWLAEASLSQQILAPRAVSMFTTQQKWLLAHIAASLYFKSIADKTQHLTMQAYVKVAVDHKVASRNTAKEFLFHLLKYNFDNPEIHFKEIQHSGVIDLSGQPTEETFVNLSTWYMAHLHALDRLDGKTRTSRFSANSMRCMALMAPVVTEGFLTCPGIRNPEPAYALFAQADEGGLLIDRFITGIGVDVDLSAAQLPINVHAITELAQGFNLSRVHTARLISKAEDLGAVGWSGRRGHSPMWISRRFHQGYLHFQAVKMAIIDAAFHAIPELRTAIT